MFDELRAHYMARYERAVAEVRATMSTVAAEIMLEVPNETEPQLLYRIMRADIIGTTTEGPQITEVNVDVLDPPKGDLAGFGIPITLRPAVWNGLELVVDGEPPADDVLLRWIAEWVDVDDQRYVASETFQGVVHSVLRPRQIASGYWTSIDFGSAPTEAVVRLIELLRPTARAIEIGSELPRANQV
jgi:hypothetical protein